MTEKPELEEILEAIMQSVTEDKPIKLSKKEAEKLVQSLDNTIKNTSTALENIQKAQDLLACKSIESLTAEEKYESRLGRAKKFLYGLGALTGLAGIVGGAYDLTAQAGNYISTAVGGAVLGGIVYSLMYSLMYYAKGSNKHPECKRIIIFDLGPIVFGAFGALANFITAPAYLAALELYYGTDPNEQLSKSIYSVGLGGMLASTLLSWLLLGATALYVSNCKKKENNSIPQIAKTGFYETLQKAGYWTSRHLKHLAFAGIATIASIAMVKGCIDFKEYLAYKNAEESKLIQQNDKSWKDEGLRLCFYKGKKIPADTTFQLESEIANHMFKAEVLVGLTKAYKNELGSRGLTGYELLQIMRIIDNEHNARDLGIITEGEAAGAFDKIKKAKSDEEIKEIFQLDIEQ